MWGCRVGRGCHPAGIGGPWRVLSRQETGHHVSVASGRRGNEEIKLAEDGCQELAATAPVFSASLGFLLKWPEVSESRSEAGGWGQRVGKYEQGSQLSQLSRHCVWEEGGALLWSSLVPSSRPPP